MNRGRGNRQLQHLAQQSSLLVDITETQPAPSSLLPAVDDLLQVNFTQSIDSWEEEGSDLRGEPTVESVMAYDYRFHGLVSADREAGSDELLQPVPVWGYQPGQPLPDEAYAIIRITDIDLSSAEGPIAVSQQQSVLGIHMDEQAAIELAKQEEDWYQQQVDSRANMLHDADTRVIKLPITDHVIDGPAPHTSPDLGQPQGGIVWDSGNGKL